MGEPAPISALNHLLYCRRRCALIHVEGIFAENLHTTRGRLEHERVDEPQGCSDEGTRVERALPLYSRRFNLVGRADLVEFRLGVPYPVEFKLGRRRRWDNDDVQICAQALCLEEMLGLSVPEGAVFHVKSRRRRPILFDPPLRTRTELAIQALHELLASRVVPPPVLDARCSGCSLHDACMPEVLANPGQANARARDLFKAQLDC